MQLEETLTATLPLGWHFAWLSKLYIGVLGKKLDHLDIDRYFVVLLLLKKAGESVCQQAICDVMNIDKTYMVKVIDYLHKHKYVTKVPSKKDRRQHMISLTDKALGIIPDIERAIREIDKEIIEQFSGQDISHIRVLLEKIGNGLVAAPHYPVALNYKRNHK